MEIGCICRLINQLFATIQNEIGVDLSLSASCGATRMCDAASVVRRALRTSEGTSSDSVQSREGRWRRPQSAEGNDRRPPRPSSHHMLLVVEGYEPKACPARRHTGRALFSNKR